MKVAEGFPAIEGRVIATHCVLLFLEELGHFVVTCDLCQEPGIKTSVQE